MKMAQTVDTVRERERESYILVKRNVELASFLTKTINVIKNKQANNVSFINNTKKADYMRNVQKPRTKGLEKVQKIA